MRQHMLAILSFFFQAEDGIRDYKVTGVQTCALPIFSDLIGFVYSGMPAQDAAAHLIASIKQSAKPVIEKGRDAVVAIILDGENAWEYYPQSGREFLRRFYSAIAADPQMEALTASETIARH